MYRHARFVRVLIAAQILVGGAHLYGFTEADFKKADAAAAGRG